MEAKDKSVFETLSGVDVNKHVEPKGKLKYLSWCWAWSEVKKRYPQAFYTIYENEQGWNYFTDGRTAWVKTGVTIEGLEHIEYLPVMDYRNQSIPVGKITSFDVNKSIQRSITKACARHGLGLYIYAGEDLPEKPEGQAPQSQPQQNQPQQQSQPRQQNKPTPEQNKQTDDLTVLVDYGKACGYRQDQMKQLTSKNFGKISLNDLNDDERHKLCVYMKQNQRGKTT